MKFVEATELHISAIAMFFREAWKMTGPDAPGWVSTHLDLPSLTTPKMRSSVVITLFLTKPATALRACRLFLLSPPDAAAAAYSLISRSMAGSLITSGSTALTVRWSDEAPARSDL